jgi:acetyl esterase/lipase
MVASSALACRAAGQAPPSADSSVFYLPDGLAEHRLDLFLPAERPFATVVFTYGGGWHSPRSDWMNLVCDAFRRHGYGCALVSHRLAPADPFPAMAQDLAAAADWVLANVQRLGGDPRRVFLAGHSSGAHLSLLLVTDAAYLRAVHRSPRDIAGVIGLSTPTDVEPRGRESYGGVLMAGRGAEAFRRDSGLMREASPLHHVSAEAPPLLLVVGSRDFPMLPADAQAFVTAQRAAGGRVELLLAEGLAHLDTVAELLDDSSQVLRRVLSFLGPPTGH